MATARAMVSAGCQHAREVPQRACAANTCLPGSAVQRSPPPPPPLPAGGGYYGYGGGYYGYSR